MPADKVAQYANRSAPLARSIMDTGYRDLAGPSSAGVAFDVIDMARGLAASEAVQEDVGEQLQGKPKKCVHEDTARRHGRPPPGLGHGSP